ncbi:MAG: hypothetical protein SP1CHLAM54_07960 [Chlamydiia bacterium]|nr:hypothetical protein [Chlamydiia bacterium]MCH9615702.1 hypothetical protein [Chlamydiia bacterium]MCH9628895.1 hypothetical protein [Chlamydiia bacterium]
MSSVPYVRLREVELTPADGIRVGTATISLFGTPITEVDIRTRSTAAEFFAKMPVKSNAQGNMMVSQSMFQMSADAPTDALEIKLVSLPEGVFLHLVSLNPATVRVGENTITCSGVDLEKEVKLDVVFSYPALTYDMFV